MPPFSTARKLRIKDGYGLRTLHAPPHFEASLGALPPGIRISAKATRYDQVHWFVRNQAQMEAELGKVLSLLKKGMVCWIYYPKLSSKIQTDLTRDRGWEALLAHGELQWLSLVSFDDTWSAFGMRRKDEADPGKPESLRERPIFDYIDAAARTVRLPEDFAAALKKFGHPSFFHSLSFTNRKEYVEWIVSAKKEETRAGRIAASIERLGMGWKNPMNR